MYNNALTKMKTSKLLLLTYCKALHTHTNTDFPFHANLHQMCQHICKHAIPHSCRHAHTADVSSGEVKQFASSVNCALKPTKTNRLKKHLVSYYQLVVFNILSKNDSNKQTN